MVFVSIRASMYRSSNEQFIENTYILDNNQQMTRSNTDSIELEEQLSEEERQRRAMQNKWKNCNIFTCKNPDTQSDYEAWLKLQKDKLNKYIKDGSKGKPIIAKEKKCPPRISRDDWEEDILTDEENEALDRLDELEGQENELNQRLKDLEQQIAEQQREFESNAMQQQQLINDAGSAQREQKDMKFYEKAVDTEVKPWQNMIKELQKKVNSYESPIKTIKDLLKKIEELKKKIETMPTGGSSAPPKKNKKSKNIGKKIKKVFR
jgi:chromosome segregation ATPase